MHTGLNGLCIPIYDLSHMHTRLHDISHESIFIQIMNVLPMPYIKKMLESVRVCVCERERENGRQSEGICLSVCFSTCGDVWCVDTHVYPVTHTHTLSLTHSHIQTLTYPVTHTHTLSLTHTRMPAHTHTHDNRLDNVALTPNHLAHSSIMKALQEARTKDLRI